MAQCEDLKSLISPKIGSPAPLQPLAPGESPFAEEKRSEAQEEKEALQRQQDQVQESMRTFVEQVQFRQPLFRALGPDQTYKVLNRTTVQQLPADLG